MPAGGVSGVPGAGLSPPAPLPSRTDALPMPPAGTLPHRSAQSALATSAKPSLLKSAATIWVGLFALTGTFVAVVKATSALAASAQASETSAASAMARTWDFRRGIHWDGPPARRPCRQGRNPEL